MADRKSSGATIPDGFQSMMTLLWYDHEEMATLQCQSWFEKLRKQFNAAAKITLDLGLFKYEQQGAEKDFSKEDAAVLARNVLQSTSPLAVDSFSKLVGQSVEKAQGALFQPSLVAIEGHLEVPLHRKYILDALFKRLATDLGYSVEGRLKAPIHSDHFMLIHDKLVELGSRLYGNDANVGYLKHNFDPEKDEADTITFRGRRLLSGFILEKGTRARDQIQFHVGLPLSAMRCLTRPMAMNGRILGWLEHQGEGQFFVRATAMASVDFLKAGSVRTT